MSVRVLVPAALALALLLSACGNSSSDSAQVDSLPANSTPTTADPYAVPERIDAAYVDKVLQAHLVVRDDVTRSVATTRTFTPTDREKLESIYDGEAFQFQVNSYQNAATRGLSEASKSASSRVSTQRVITGDRSCIWAEVLGEGTGGSTLYGFVLRPATPTGRNITGWKETQFTSPSQLSTSNAC